MTENLWAAEQAALVRGIAHALSNRVGTIVAAAGMLAPGDPAPAPVVSVLRDEGVRLEGLLALTRLLGGDEAGAPEPVHLPDVVAPTVELHEHHPASRDVPCVVTPDPLAPPVRVRHAGLVRALLVLLSAAKRGDGARVAWHGEGAGVALTVDGAAGDAATAAAAADLLGAPVHPTPTGYRCDLPGL